MYLNCHTYFSLKYGTLSIAELIAEAVDKGAEALALTDINNTSAAFDFIKSCGENNIKPILGLEFRNEDELLYVGLAQNNAGFQELNEFYSSHRHIENPFPDRAPVFNNVFVIYPLATGRDLELKAQEYIGIRPEEVNKLYKSPLKQRQEKLLIFQPVTFKDKKGYNLHRLLRAIDKNSILSKLEPGQQAGASEVMLHTHELLEHYKSYPKIIYNTMQLLDKCNIDFNLEASKNRKTFTGSRDDDRALLQKLAMDGLKWRYGIKNKEARQRVVRELEIIDKLNFSAYFLITWDIIRYGQSRGFFHVGRGSGANSIVAYCLGITDVDPVELDLYFERFLNPYRTAPPDFDIDFSWKDRDEVIDYIFKRYGSRHTSLMATYVTFRGRSIIRELGKVFGLPKPEIDEIVKYPEKNKNRDHITKLIFQYGKYLEGMPKHLSIHAGGILITEDPMSAYTATDIPPKGFPITHFDMFVAEENGFYKYDILSQRGLGHIKETMEVVYENRGKYIDIHQVEQFKKDPQVNALLKEGNTIGCFYIESPAMRQLLKKLKCDNYPNLVAASSIIRPGVAKSGMMREYIYRHHHPEDFQYIHPKMEELLEETYGVMVYQEDVIKVAHHFAGIGLAEADILRRGMSGKRRSKGEIQKIEEDFYINCAAKGIEESIAKEVWRQIESFSGYSFSKAHSASFAVESYQSLYLKTYYPYEFMVAVINNFGGFYNTEFYVREAQRTGAGVHCPCVNKSNHLTCIYGDDIYLGFIHVYELEKKLAAAIPEEREKNGPYLSLQDFTERVPVSVEQLNILIRVGAMRFSGKSKKELLWEAQMLLKKEPIATGPALFKMKSKDFKLPVLEHRPFEDAYDEIELLGFPICSPFEMLSGDYPDTITVDQMMAHVGQVVQIVGNLNAIKDVRTVKMDMMQFASFWDSKLNLFDTVHFPDVSMKHGFGGPGFYLLTGKITEEFGVPAMEVKHMKKLPIVPDPRMI